MTDTFNLSQADEVEHISPVEWVNESEEESSSEDEWIDQIEGIADTLQQTLPLVNRVPSRRSFLLVSPPAEHSRLQHPHTYFNRNNQTKELSAKLAAAILFLLFISMLYAQCKSGNFEPRALRRSSY